MAYATVPPAMADKNEKQKKRAGRKKNQPGEGFPVQIMVRLSLQLSALLQAAVKLERDRRPDHKFDQADAVRAALSTYVRDRLPPAQVKEIEDRVLAEVAADRRR